MRLIEVERGGTLRHSERLFESCDFEVRLSENSSAEIKFALLAKGAEDVEINVRIVHLGGGSKSRIALFGAADDGARISFRTMLEIAGNLEGIEAGQYSRIMLLSPSARGKIEPFQAVASEKVRASHSAAVYSADTEAIWFLALRGIPERAAKKLLLDAMLDV